MEDKQKQHLIDMMKSDEELGLYEEPKQTDENGKPLTYWGGLKEPIQETCNCIDECLGYLTKTCKRIEEPKQETLEEAKFKSYKEYWNEYHTQLVKSNFINGFENGAKWQQKIMYSEEDIKKAFKVGFSIGYGSDTYAIYERNKTCEEWFEQFKKK